MTTNELREFFNGHFGMEKWPKKYGVDAETYGNVANDLLKWLVDRQHMQIRTEDNMKFVEIAIGPNNGIMFKGVELILE